MGGGAADYHVEVVSKDIIKPCRETPSHLKTWKFSLLDQLISPIYIPIIFFYEADAVRNPAEMCQKLKQSLSRALATYHPVAGKPDLVNLCIQCSDDGAEFVEARVHARLSDLLSWKEQKDLEWIKKHLPVLVDSPGEIIVGDGPNFRVQVNFFECGGISVAACTSHTVADGASMVQFIHECGEDDQKNALPADFNSFARFLPVQDLSQLGAVPAFNITNAMGVVKSYVFSKEKLNAIRRMATSNLSSSSSSSSTCRRSDFVDNPTRVELAVGFIWKAFMSINWDANKSFNAAQAVNLRRRACKSFQLENAFGNCAITAATSISPPNEAVPPLAELVSQLRKTVRGINDEYTRKMRDENRYLNSFLESVGSMIGKGESNWCMFSSWCGFPVYEVNFGWGKPAWVSTVSGVLKDINVTIVRISMGAGLGRMTARWYEPFINSLSLDNF